MYGNDEQYRPTENNLFILDPATCGCTECLVGEYHPFTPEAMDAAVALHFEEGTEVVSHTDNSYIMFTTKDGEYGYTEIGGSPSEIDVVSVYDVSDAVFAALCQQAGVDNDDSTVLVVVLDYDDVTVTVAPVSRMRTYTIVRPGM